MVDITPESCSFLASSASAAAFGRKLLGGIWTEEGRKDRVESANNNTCSPAFSFFQKTTPLHSLHSFRDSTSSAFSLFQKLTLLLLGDYSCLHHSFHSSKDSTSSVFSLFQRVILVLLNEYSRLHCYQ